MIAVDPRAALEDYFRAHPDGLACAWLFGSVARGTAGPRSDGVLILDQLPLERARFESRSRNAYFDLKPFLDRYRRVPGSPAGG